MPSNWGKGFTKENHPSIRKISETMKLKKIDNFHEWRAKMRAEGKIKTFYPLLKKDGNLAELIGVTLGDGHICVYPRTEELRITSNANNNGFVKRYAKIIEEVFKKKSYIIQGNQAHTTKVGIYERHISKRMGIASGARGRISIKIPSWILKEKKYIVRYLRGLYEAEGSFSVHKPTYTYKFQFSNRNQSMSDNVFKLMTKIGFHPHRSRYQVQISKKREVYEAINLLRFRKY